MTGEPASRIEVDVDRDEVDWVSGLLWSVGVSAVEEGVADDGRRTTLVTAPDSPEVRAALGDRWVVRSVPVDEHVLDTWKAWAHPVSVGQLLVVPAWQAVPPAPVGTTVVRLEPGRAFGHGNHPTTRAVLAEVSDHARTGTRVLDVGTGSGVLAVAAAALGAEPVVAIDVSPGAVEVARANAVANGVEGRISVSSTPVSAVAASFDLVLANIGADVLVSLSSVLVARTVPGGRLVVSGLLEERRDEVVAAYRPMPVERVVVDEGWCTVAFLRPLLSG